jgi:CBS domain-containing protein
MALNITIRVKAAMKKEIVSVNKDDSIRSAIRKMIRGNMGSVVVVDEDRPVGIVTERDILKSIAYKRANTDGPVGTIMSAPLISIDAYATLGEAADMMIKRKVRRLLVKENDEYVGIITQRDLQSLMVDTFKALLLE